MIASFCSSVLLGRVFLIMSLQFFVWFRSYNLVCQSRTVISWSVNHLVALDSSLTLLIVSFKFLNWLCLTVFIRLWSSLLLVHLFVPHFSLPVNVPRICFDTALYEQPALSPVTFYGLLVEGSYCLLHSCKISSQVVCT